MLRKIIHKIIATSSLIGILFLSPSFVYASNPTLIFSPDSGTISPGCSFNVDIVVDTGGISTDGTDAFIKFDPSQLSTSSDKITKGNIYENFLISQGNATDGRVNVSGFSENNPFNGKGVLATVQFTVLPGVNSGNAQLNFDWVQGQTNESNIVERGTIQDVMTQPSPANFTLSSSGCVNTASQNPNVKNGTGITTPTAAPLATKKPVGGTFTDLNNNGIDDSSESGLIKKPLPNTAITAPTWIFVLGGGALTILGIVGLAML